MNSFRSGPSEFDARSIVIRLKTKYADCRITLKVVANTFIVYYNFSSIDQKNQSYPYFFLIYILSHREILVPIGPGAKEFLIRH